MFKYCTPAVIEGVTKIFNTTPLSHKYLEVLASFQPYGIDNQLLPGIEHIRDIRQIDDFRTITKNFTDISQLKPYEILYLNYCNWFYPTYCKINAKVKAANLEICINNEIIKIDKFGLYHVYLNDMKPIKASASKAFDTALKGGHMFFPDLKSKTHQLSDFKLLDDGYFTLKVKHIEDTSATDPEFKTFFPVGKTPEECADIVIDAIKNPKHVELLENRNPKVKAVMVTNQQNQQFKICVTNQTATFFRFIEEE